MVQNSTMECKNGVLVNILESENEYLGLLLKKTKCLIYEGEGVNIIKNFNEIFSNDEILD
jgi:hypothetical protein